MNNETINASLIKREGINKVILGGVNEKVMEIVL